MFDQNTHIVWNAGYKINEFKHDLVKGPDANVDQELQGPEDELTTIYRHVCDDVENDHKEIAACKHRVVQHGVLFEEAT